MCPRLWTSHVVSDWLWCWQLWGDWNWKPCQSVLHLAWGPTSGCGFPFPKKVTSTEHRVKGVPRLFWRAIRGPKHFKHLSNSWKILGPPRLYRGALARAQIKHDTWYHFTSPHTDPSECPGTRERDAFRLHKEFRSSINWLNLPCDSRQTS